MKSELPENTIIEVVLRKNMTVSEYKRIIEQSIKKGWNIKAFQIGKFSEATQNKID